VADRVRLSGAVNVTERAAKCGGADGGCSSNTRDPSPSDTAGDGSQAATASGFKINHAGMARRRDSNGTDVAFLAPKRTRDTAIASAVSFSVGAVAPVDAAANVPLPDVIIVVSATSPACLPGSGALAARTSRASVATGTMASPRFVGRPGHGGKGGGGSVVRCDCLSAQTQIRSDPSRKDRTSAGGRLIRTSAVPRTLWEPEVSSTRPADAGGQSRPSDRVGRE